MAAIHRNWGITREQIAREGVYFSHETCTHATPTASCAFNEVSALRQCFGEELLSQLVIINTKVTPPPDALEKDIGNSAGERERECVLCLFVR